MRYLSHYFPYLIITLILYGVIFHFHKKTTLIPPLPINSGIQAIQLQLIDATETPPQAIVNEEQEQDAKELQDEPEAQPEQEEKEPEKHETKKVVEAESEKVIEPPAKEQTAKQPNEEVSAENPSAIKIARKKLQKTIAETSAFSDATLKAELFEESNKLNSDAPTRPRKTAQRTTPTKVQATKPPLAKSKVVKKMAPTEPLEKQAAVQPQQDEKPVIKKQPTASAASIQNQGVLQEAIVVSGNAPTYPKRAILRNQQGRVTVKLTVTMKGEAKNAQIVTSSGHSILDNAILDFIENERFMPAHKGEEKITTEQLFSFRFELK